MDELKARAKKAGAQGEIDLQKELEQLQTRRDAIQEKLRGVSQTGQDAWGEIKQGLERAAGELKSALDQAAGRLK